EEGATSLDGTPHRDREEAEDSADRARGVEGAESLRADAENVARQTRKERLVREAEDLRSRREHHERKQCAVSSDCGGEVDDLAPDGARGAACCSDRRRGGQERGASREIAGRDGEIASAGSEMRDDPARAERAEKPPRAHRHAEGSES